jgi:membrane protease YdiL (CAAX protease family)
VEITPAEYVIAALVLGAVAIAVWVFLPAFQGAQAARRGTGTHRLVVGSQVVVLALNALLTVPLAGRLEHGFDPFSFILAAAATQIPMVLVIVGRLVLPGAATWEELGLRPLPLGRLLATGIATGLGALALTVIMDMILGSVGLGNNQSQEFQFIQGAAPGVFAIVLIPIVFTAPVVEELFFRGFIFGLYLRRQAAWVAYLVSGLLFGLLHITPNVMNPAQALGLLLTIAALGTLFAWTYRRTGSLYPGMIAHALNNGVAIVALYLAGRGLP